MVKGTVAGQYRFLLWGGGFLQVIIGLLLLLLPSLFLDDVMDLAYPYLTESTILLIQIIGWIEAISGILSIVSGLWAGTLSKINLELPVEDEMPGDMGISRTILIVSSIIIMIGFPIGTFIGITLLREILIVSKEIKVKR